MLMLKDNQCGNLNPCSEVPFYKHVNHLLDSTTILMPQLFRSALAYGRYKDKSVNDPLFQQKDVFRYTSTSEISTNRSFPEVLITFFEFKQATRSVMLIMFTVAFCSVSPTHSLSAWKILSTMLFKLAYRIDVMCSDHPIKFNGLAQPNDRAFFFGPATNIYISSLL
jgi:hypothetical protein